MISQLIAQQKTLIHQFFDGLDGAILDRYVDTLHAVEGLIFFSGVGKSGFIAQKLAVTWTSIGKRAFFLHPTDALHGDIAAVAPGDLVILLSKSGNTEELFSLVPCLRERGASTHSWVCQPNTPLERQVDHTILLPLARELCPFNLAPVTSSGLQLLFGDLLATALIHKQALTLTDYARNHPAGYIGKKAQLQVKDLMWRGDGLPTCRPSDLLEAALAQLTQKRLGCLVVVDEAYHAIGIVTDGDIRRALEQQGPTIAKTPISTLMTVDYLSVQEDSLAIEAKQAMQALPQRWVSVLPVLKGKTLTGIIRMHDLVAL